jgi:hypothetical protein
MNHSYALYMGEQDASDRLELPNVIGTLTDYAAVALSCILNNLSWLTGSVSTKLC